MKKDLTLPNIGDDENSAGEVVALIEIGSLVSPGDILMEVETGKSLVEVPATEAGTICELAVAVGDKVRTGLVFATIDVASQQSGTDSPDDFGSTASTAATSPRTEQESITKITSQPKEDLTPGGNLERLLLPTFGEDGREGTVLSIVSAGSQFVEGDVLLEVETGKSVLEVPATCAGTVVKPEVTAGQSVYPGMPYCTVSTATNGTSTKTTPEEAPTRHSSPTAPPVNNVVNQVPLSPAGESVPPSDDDVQVKIPAGPAARRMARTLGIDIREVAGSGPRGRVTKEDVVQHAKTRLQRPSIVETVKSSKLPDITRFGNTRREDLTAVANATSQNMQRAWSEIPHAWVQAEVDITELDALRREIKQSNPLKPPLTITAILCKIAAIAVKRFPIFNSVFDAQANQIVYREYINIGVAVDTPRGLLVPCLLDVASKTSLDIAFELKNIGEKATKGKLTMTDLQGAGFTISNLGGLGATGLFPIVNWPEVAILGVGASRTQCALHNGNVQNREIMPLTLGFDHRVINGADAARFLGFIRKCIERPATLLIEA